MTVTNLTQIARAGWNAYRARWGETAGKYSLSEWHELPTDYQDLWITAAEFTGKERGYALDVRARHIYGWVVPSQEDVGKPWCPWEDLPGWKRECWRDAAEAMAKAR